MPDWTFCADSGTNAAMQPDAFTSAALSKLQVRLVERHEEPRYKEQMALHHYLGDLSKIGETLWYVVLCPALKWSRRLTLFEGKKRVVSHRNSAKRDPGLTWDLVV